MAEINNALYDTLGDRWYTAFDDPVAILRAVNKAKVPWMLARLPKESDVLDVGCGGGLISNALSEAGHHVTGVDLSPSSLAVAARWDRSGKARYLQADAYALPFPSQSFSAVVRARASPGRNSLLQYAQPHLAELARGHQGDGMVRAKHAAPYAPAPPFPHARRTGRALR
jgi:SAM-dependent methyltransferase